MKKTIISIIVIVLMVIIALFVVNSINNRYASAGNIATDKLAQHLTESGLKLYGSNRCSACEYQKELFKDSWQYIDYIGCGVDGGGQTELCQAEDIRAYPTWEFPDGTKQTGALSLGKLAELSGFQLND